MAWPTTDDPRTEFATLRFTRGEMKDVEDAALAAGQKKSEYIRSALHRVIVADKRKQAARAASEGEPVLNEEGQ